MTRSFATLVVAALWLAYGAYVVWLGLAHDTPLSLVAGPIYSIAGAGFLFERRWAIRLLLGMALFTVAAWIYVVAGMGAPHALGSVDTRTMVVGLLPGLALMLMMVISAIVAIRHLRLLRR